jgi:UDP:flavonoid glycosyltransferase YjiC (YdhE family)
LNWAPQVDILKKASLAIIHGGLGSIKECIYYGVPMIIVPMGFDQYRNAEIISTRHLGITRKMEDLTEHILLSEVSRIPEDQEIKKNIRNMQQIFRESEASQPGNQIIEALLQHPR